MGVEKARSVNGHETRTIVSRYGERHWAVYLNGELLAVTVYKKGALAVQDALSPTPCKSREITEPLDKAGSKNWGFSFWS